MKKIISMFLILSLISGCDKANTLKPIQPVKNQIIQSDDSQVSQSNNNQAVQLNNNQNTETNKQTHYSTGSTVAYIVGGVIVLALAGYAIYRCYHSVPAKAPYEPKPKEEERKVMSPQEIAEEERQRKIAADHNTFGGGVLPRDFSSEDISLFTEEERKILAERQECSWYQKNYDLLLFIYARRCRRDDVFPILTSINCPICGSEKTRALLDEYQKEMVFRRANPHLIPLDAIPSPEDYISPIITTFPDGLKQYLSLFTSDEYAYCQNVWEENKPLSFWDETDFTYEGLIDILGHFYIQLKKKGVSVAEMPLSSFEGKPINEKNLIIDTIYVDEFKKEMVRRCTGYQPMDFVDE
jgi:hypothetical protein